jgi:hypothetical protein
VWRAGAACAHCHRSNTGLCADGVVASIVHSVWVYLCARAVLRRSVGVEPSVPVVEPMCTCVRVCTMCTCLCRAWVQLCSNCRHEQSFLFHSSHLHTHTHCTPRNKYMLLTALSQHCVLILFSLLWYLTSPYTSRPNVYVICTRIQVDLCARKCRGVCWGRPGKTQPTHYQSTTPSAHCVGDGTCTYHISHVGRVKHTHPHTRPTHTLH